MRKGSNHHAGGGLRSQSAAVGPSHPASGQVRRGGDQHPSPSRDPGRLVRVVGLMLVVLGVAAVSGYLGLRVGRSFERNVMCCDVPLRHNLALSLREALGFVRFPSQIGQDRWVTGKVFPGVNDGYFLDVGAADGYTNSNTWALEQRGWTGICIDPFPSGMDGRTCQVFTEVVGSTAGQTVTFAEAGELGGITDHLGRWKTDLARANIGEFTTVTLGDILRRAEAPSHIHFMSLDIEGAELEALRGFPFDRHTLGALAIEHNHEEPKRTELEQFLAARGYVRARSWMQDDFYLPRRRE